VRGFREALDALEAGRPIVSPGLLFLTEGQSTTTGAYRKTWR
jgi:putative protease